MKSKYVALLILASIFLVAGAVLELDSTVGDFINFTGDNPAPVDRSMPEPVKNVNNADNPIPVSAPTPGRNLMIDNISSDMDNFYKNGWGNLYERWMQTQSQEDGLTSSG